MTQVIVKFWFDSAGWEFENPDDPDESASKHFVYQGRAHLEDIPQQMIEDYHLAVERLQEASKAIKDHLEELGHDHPWTCEKCKGTKVP